MRDRQQRLSLARRISQYSICDLQPIYSPEPQPYNLSLNWHYRTTTWPSIWSPDPKIYVFEIIQYYNKSTFY